MDAPTILPNSRVMELEKSPRIKEAIRDLARALGPDAFEIVDHWEADMLGIGIASPLDHDRLVYIAEAGAAGFYVDLETASEAGSEIPYRVVRTLENASFSELIEAARCHFDSA